MVAILETPAIRRQVSPFSVENYARMGEQVFGRRTGMIRGVILAKMSSSPLHSFLVARLRRLVAAFLGADLYCREEQPLKLDREKAALYAEAAVPEHWIVLGEAQSVEVYLASQDGRCTRHRRSHRQETIHSAALPALTVNLAALFPGE